MFGHILKCRKLTINVNCCLAAGSRIIMANQKLTWFKQLSVDILVPGFGLSTFHESKQTKGEYE